MGPRVGQPAFLARPRVCVRPGEDSAWLWGGRRTLAPPLALSPARHPVPHAASPAATPKARGRGSLSRACTERQAGSRRDGWTRSLAVPEAGAQCQRWPTAGGRRLCPIQPRPLLHAGSGALPWGAPLPPPVTGRPSTALCPDALPSYGVRRLRASRAPPVVILFIPTVPCSRSQPGAMRHRGLANRHRT